MSDIMTRSDRDTLIKIARQRERLAKSDAKSRAALLLADFEKQMDTYYHYDTNEVWETAVEMADKAVQEAQKAIEAECQKLGIPDQFAPTLRCGWHGKGRNASKEERAEMRRIATRQIDAMTKSASTEIERKSIATQERIMVGGLSTHEARLFLEEMPSAENLMPSLSIGSVETLLLEQKKPSHSYY